MLETAEDRRASWFGGDLKVKWRPSRDRSLTASTEVLVQERDLEPTEDGGAPGSASPLGAFACVDYQFLRRWNAGALLDYVQAPEDTDESRLGLGAFAGFSLFEESTVLRLLVRHDAMPPGEEDATSVQLQAIFALGPHKAHQF